MLIFFQEKIFTKSKNGQKLKVEMPKLKVETPKLKVETLKLKVETTKLKVQYEPPRASIKVALPF